MRFFFTLLSFSFIFFRVNAQSTLVFHPVQTDGSGNILPWYNPNHGSSYDHDLNLIWNFWKNIPTSGGNKFYMMDHSYSPQLASNKVGGDQFAMLLSSWALYYAYSGDTDFIKNMIYIANTYLANSLSSPSAVWGNLPYPCNYANPSIPIYDGDFILGSGVTQPDKAGSFGNELVTLYKITSDSNYLNAAVKIANTLASNVQPGDSSNSPYPFKVYAQTGNAVFALPGANYTVNVVPTLLLFENLKKLNRGNTVQYDTATAVISRWVKRYPLQDNNWGCFFEDIPVYSNTETNAVTMAWYILEHPDWSATWQQDARGILDWTLATLGSHAYDSLGVTAIYEQSSDLKEGGSHTSRFASVELVYAEKTGDTSRITQAIRQLDWATYLVDTSGQCRFSPRESSVWYTDGYGDYVRHYLRAMAADPSIAPDSTNHLLGSSSVITHITYNPAEINYTTFDDSSVETLRVTSKPIEVKANGTDLNELTDLNAEGWVWIPYGYGGVVKVNHNHTNRVDIIWNGTSIQSVDANNDEIELFPNPASRVVKINYTENNNEQIKIRLLDITGKLIKEVNFKANKLNNLNEINIDNLQAGTYFVQFSSEKNYSCKKLIVID